MGEPDPSKEVTLAWLRGQFRRYYASRKPILPDRFGRREFGFMFWSAGIVQRHIGFSREEELRGFLETRVPAHVYYSSAYYEKPDAPTMEEKGWLGADLIFDLDADHLPGAKLMTYPQMLEAVREGIAKLWDRFLVDQFGFQEAKMRLVFSGGRGYHIHVYDERIRGLGTHERREIVDFLTAKGLDGKAMFKESPFDKKEYEGHVRVKVKIVAPSTSAPGWAGIIARGLRDLTIRLEELGPDAAVEFLASVPGVGRDRAKALVGGLFKVRTTRPRVIRAVDRVREGQIEALADPDRDTLIDVVTSLERIPLTDRGELSLENIREIDARRQRAETDEPVTSDIKRLIRMPSSLHGKTGFEVVPLTRDELDDFRPLRDAIPVSWTDERVKVRLASGITSEMKDETFKLAPGVNDVPQFLAIFLAARGIASVVQEG